MVFEIEMSSLRSCRQCSISETKLDTYEQNPVVNNNVITNISPAVKTELASAMIHAKYLEGVLPVNGKLKGIILLKVIKK